MNLTNRLQHLMAACEEIESKGELIPPELEEELVNYLTTQGEKVDSLASFVSRVEKNVEWLEDEVKVLELEIKKQNRQIERVKSLAKFVMEKNDVRKIEGIKGHSFCLRNSESVKITDEDKIPARYMKITQTSSPDKAMLKNDLANGLEVEGAVLQKNRNVVIK